MAVPIAASEGRSPLRFFLRNGGGLLGALKVDVVMSNGLTLPVGLGGTWTIDDVYVDPYKKG